MFESDLNAPFVELLTGAAATLFAVKFYAKMSTLSMHSEVWTNTQAYWTPEACAQRAVNRKLFFDRKYPERPYIVMPGDKQWPN